MSKSRFFKFYITALGHVAFMLSTSSVIHSQPTLCNGNLGPNIFTEGDFGRGNDVIYPTDPGLAPGFEYTTIVPPSDGKYTLTYNMALWASQWPTWLSIGDNSPDPKGYMMVINASFTPGIFYEQTVNGICENTTYEFSADIINLIRSGVVAHILPNVSFLINDIVVYSSGQIPQDEKWHTYGSSYTSGPGQTSLKLSLRNNAPGGGGNDLAIDNLSFRTCGSESSISISQAGKICEETLYPVLTAHVDSDSFAVQWQISLDSGMVWNDLPGATGHSYVIDSLSAAVHYYRFIYGSSPFNLANPQCAVESDTIIVEIVPIENNISVIRCEGLTYTLGGIDYTQPGIYQQHLTAANGCDSLIIIDLSFIPDPPVIAEFDIEPPSCLGADDGIIALSRVSGARPPFIFRLNDSIIPPPTSAVNVPAGTYTVAVENEFGCFDEQQVIVPDGPVFKINAMDDITITLGHSILLKSDPNVPVVMSVWNPTDALSCAGCLVPIAKPLEDVTYYITAKSEGGCIDSDSIMIRVEKEPVLFVPNIFSPNNDGLNDLFIVSTDPLNVVSIDRAIIFDRWGGVMLEKNSLSSEGESVLWDGFARNGEVDPGVYVYIIEFTLANGSTRRLSGDVTVVR